MSRTSQASPATHVAARDRLRAQYAQIPRGQPVRLAKRTSNLFRQRDPHRAPGLDVSAFGQVLSVDSERLVADVQGMTTYERLVDAALAQGCMPLVVPQLKTITLGGAVSGLGVEASSFRNGLPHESVCEMEIRTGSGDIVTARPDGEHADLFRAFPNSYGSLGYALRLRIELERVHPFVKLRHIRFTELDALVTAIGESTDSGTCDAEAVDFVDAVVFSASESYLVLGSWADTAPLVSDYTGRHIYYRSIQQRSVDYLSVRDYLWRWDTDWFWCSRAFGVQDPRVRRLLPRRWLRSDVYGRLVRFESRHQWFAKRDARRSKPPRERVVQDVEIPIGRTVEFLEWFLREVPIEPIWLCPLALRDTEVSRQGWPLYPLSPGETYVNVGFWSSVEIQPGAVDGDVNLAVERQVSSLGGHKSLYSDAYYDEPEFRRLYGGDTYGAVKKTYDPDLRLPDIYDKAVRRR